MRARLRAADELHRDCEIAEATWRGLATHHRSAELVEIVYVAGQYRMLSMVANGLGIGASPGSDPLPVPVGPRLPGDGRRGGKAPK